MAGSLLAAGTGSIGFISQQAKAKSKKRRRSEAAATDASRQEAAAATAPPLARPDQAADGLSAKERKKAAKQLRRAAASGSARATALVDAGTGPTVPAQAQAPIAPDSTTRPIHNQEVAGKLNPLNNWKGAFPAFPPAQWLLLLPILLFNAGVQCMLTTKLDSVLLCATAALLRGQGCSHFTVTPVNAVLLSESFCKVLSASLHQRWKLLSGVHASPQRQYQHLCTHAPREPAKLEIWLCVASSCCAPEDRS